MLAALDMLLAPTLAAARDSCRMIGRITLAAPGIVNPGLGVLVDSPAMGWRDVNLRAQLAELIDCPIAAVGIDSIGSLATLAESRLPEYRGVRSMVRLEAGVGIGSGYMLDGRAQRGAAGMAGTIGHCVVDPGGPVCCRADGGDASTAYAGLPALLQAACPRSRQPRSRRCRRPGGRAGTPAPQQATGWWWPGSGTWAPGSDGAPLHPHQCAGPGNPRPRRFRDEPRALDPAHPRVRARRPGAQPRPGRTAGVEVSALGRDGALIGAAVAGRDHIFDNPMQITNGVGNGVGRADQHHGLGHDQRRPPLPLQHGSPPHTTSYQTALPDQLPRIQLPRIHLPRRSDLIGRRRASVQGHAWLRSSCSARCPPPAEGPTPIPPDWPAKGM